MMEDWRWKTITRPITSDIGDGKSLINALEHARDLYGGYICGKCEKRLEEGEGQHITIDWEMAPVPGMGWVKLPPRVSDAKYCDECRQKILEDHPKGGG